MKWRRRLSGAGKALVATTTRSARDRAGVGRTLTRIVAPSSTHAPVTGGSKMRTPALSRHLGQAPDQAGRVDQPVAASGCAGRRGRSAKPRRRARPSPSSSSTSSPWARNRSARACSCSRPGAPHRDAWSCRTRGSPRRCRRCAEEGLDGIEVLTAQAQQRRASPGPGTRRRVASRGSASGHEATVATAAHQHRLRQPRAPRSNGRDRARCASRAAHKPVNPPPMMTRSARRRTGKAPRPARAPRPDRSRRPRAWHRRASVDRLTAGVRRRAQVGHAAIASPPTASIRSAARRSPSVARTRSPAAATRARMAASPSTRLEGRRHLAWREAVRVEAHAEARLVDALRVVVLVPEQRQARSSACRSGWPRWWCCCRRG